MKKKNPKTSGYDSKHTESREGARIEGLWESYTVYDECWWSRSLRNLRNFFYLFIWWLWNGQKHFRKHLRGCSKTVWKNKLQLCGVTSWPTLKQPTDENKWATCCFYLFSGYCQSRRDVVSAALRLQSWWQTQRSTLKYAQFLAKTKTCFLAKNGAWGETFFRVPQWPNSTHTHSEGAMSRKFTVEMSGQLWFCKDHQQIKWQTSSLCGKKKVLVVKI